MKIVSLPFICVFLLLGFTRPAQNHYSRFTPVSIDRDDLFGSDQVLNIKLSGKIHDLLDDRGDAPALHPLQLSYKGADSNLLTIPVQAKTRGHFRKLAENCNYPPVLLNFSSKDLPANSIFSGQVKLKLVMPCQGDEYVVREWLVYKLYNLITPKSFRARLVRVELDDTEKKKQAKTFFGVLLEDENEMAKRNHMVIAERKLLKMEETEITTFLKMSVFQYLIGNTDWSVQYQQNIKLIVTDPKSVPYTVPYDFDHAGIVNTPYAQPAEELELRSTRDRRYRGFCIADVKEFKETIDFFNHLKESIYSLYTSSPLLDAKYVKSTTQFLDGFYATINDEKKMKADFTYPCNKNGTGNVIIRGLKNN